MTLEQVDRTLGGWMRSHGHTALRIGLGVVFLWFGAPKLVPGLSPAEELVRATVPFLSVPLLGVGEMLIGLCLLVPALTRVGLVLLAVHMIGAALPLVLLPDVAWKAFPVATFEGQYILKNMVLVAGAMVLGGATVAERRRPPVARRSEACGSTSGSPRRFCSCVGAGR